MACPTCSSDNPEVASFCNRCGTSLVRTGQAKRVSYAVQSAEGVTQFALISTVMPHTSRRSADNYRWAMILSGVLILGATALGLLPIAIAAAAFLVPLAYLVYIDDVNLWEEAPAAVVVGLFVATGALAVLVSLFFFDWVFDAQWASFAGGGRARGGIGSMSFPALLIFAVLLPVVAEVAKNVFAVLLAARPQFDDMIDGLTFGVAAGTSYAAFETIVVYSSVFTAQDFRTTSGIASWLIVVVNVMVDQVADLRHRDRHRGGVVLRQGRGVRRLHAGVLRELRPRGRRQRRLLARRPADGLPAVRQRARPDLGLRDPGRRWSSRSG